MENRPPSGPLAYRVRFQDGEVRTIDAHWHQQILDSHVFFADDWSVVARLPQADVTAVEANGAAHRRAARRKA